MPNRAKLPDEYHEPMTLQEFAARVAMDELLSNWENAVLDGHQMPYLLKDVDEVCRILQAWKEALS